MARHRSDRLRLTDIFDKLEGVGGRVKGIGLPDWEVVSG